MSLFAKIMVIVNLVLAVIFLASAGTFLGAADSWKKKYDNHAATQAAEIQALQEQVKDRQGKLDAEIARGASIQTALSSAEANLANLQESNANLQSSLNKAEQSNATLADAQQNFQNQLKDIETNLTRARSERDSAKADAAQARDESETLRTQLAQETQGHAATGENLAAAESNNEDLVALNNTIQLELDMYRKVKGVLSDVISMTPVTAIVKAVDVKNDIVVISAGSNEGVKPGYELTVYNSGGYVSTIVIDRVFDNYASGSTKAGLGKKDISAGDKVSNNL